jgi:hypothetical protein
VKALADGLVVSFSKFSRFKKTILLCSLGLCALGLTADELIEIAEGMLAQVTAGGVLGSISGVLLTGLRFLESKEPFMTVYVAVAVVVIEVWVAMARRLKAEARTTQAEAIADAVIHTAHASAVSNNIAYFVTPYLLTMNSYPTAIFFSGYGLFRYVSSMKEDGRELKLNLLKWFGSVAGGGVAINVASFALQMRSSRLVLGLCLMAVAIWLISKANRRGDARPASTNGKPRDSNGDASQKIVLETSE